MISAVLAAVGYQAGGVAGALIAISAPTLVGWLRTRSAAKPPPRRLVYLLVLVELRSGMSVLGALHGASRSLPDDEDLARLVRLGLVAGLRAALDESDARLRPLLLALVRAQHTGASLTESVRRLIDDEIRTERTDAVSRARRLPVRLMIPITLLMLPGLILVIYAPGLLAMFDQLTGVFS